MGLSRTVSEVNGNLGRKSQSFPTPVYLTTLLMEFPCEFCNGGSTQKGSCPNRKVESVDDVRLDTIPQCEDGRTDGIVKRISRSVCIATCRAIITALISTHFSTRSQCPGIISWYRMSWCLLSLSAAIVIQSIRLCGLQFQSDLRC